MEGACLFSKKNQYNAELHKYGNIFVIGSLIISAMLNSLAFAQHAQGIMLYPAIAFGVIVPAAIYLLTKSAASLYNDYSRG